VIIHDDDSTKGTTSVSRAPLLTCFVCFICLCLPLDPEYARNLSFQGMIDSPTDPS
jgi:hypothetical protein